MPNEEPIQFTNRNHQADVSCWFSWSSPVHLRLVLKERI